MRESPTSLPREAALGERVGLTPRIPAGIRAFSPDGLLDHGMDLDLWRVGFTVSNPASSQDQEDYRSRKERSHRDVKRTGGTLRLQQALEHSAECEPR